MEGTNSDNGSDDEDFPASQSEHDMYTTMREKYGGLPKAKFKQVLSERFDTNDLSTYRHGLYAVAKVVNKNTQNGTLVFRKDTSHKGGATEEIKLAEDIYNIMQYIDGDDSIDLQKMFTARSKNTIRQQTVAENNGEQQKVPSTPSAAVDMTLQEFCTTMLVEMRTDRDMYCREMCKVTQCLERVTQMEKTVQRMDSELLETRDRVTRLEGLVHEHGKLEKRMHKQTEYTSELKQLIEKSLDIGNEAKNQVGQLYGSVTQRINGLELLLRQNVQQRYADAPPGAITQRLVRQNNGTQDGGSITRITAQPGSSPHNVDTSGSRNQNADTSVLRHQNADTSVLRHQNADTSVLRHQNADMSVFRHQSADTSVLRHHSADTSVRRHQNADTSVLRHQNADTAVLRHQNAETSVLSEEIAHMASNARSQEGTSTSPMILNKGVNRNITLDCNNNGEQRNTRFTVIVPSEAGVPTSGINPSGAHRDTNILSSSMPNNARQVSDLQGFMPVPKDKTVPLFLTGILMNNDSIEDTIGNIKTHITSMECSVKSARKIKVSGDVMSAKVIISKQDEEKLLSKDFWPKGIYCRQWYKQ